MRLKRIELHDYESFWRRAHLDRTVKRLAFLSLLPLSGCYFPNQSEFEQSVHGEVSVGMPLKTAVANLRNLKLACTGSNPSDCSRIRQSILPYSCVERVRLQWSGEDQVVQAINIPKIACAGL
jgi:hypothetical protein